MLSATAVAVKSLRPQAAGDQATRRLLELFARIAGAVDELHNAGIIHKDINPSNILINQDQAIRLIDFGLVRFALGHIDGPLGDPLRSAVFCDGFESGDALEWNG